MSGACWLPWLFQNMVASDMPFRGGRPTRYSQTQSNATWSWKFRPTPGRCCRTGIPCCLSSSSSPMPESISTFGVLIAPSDNTTSTAGPDVAGDSVVDDVDAAGPPSLEGDPVDVCHGEDGQVGPVQVGEDVGAEYRLASAVADAQVGEGRPTGSLHH